jgi:multidrug resistance efflux pump
MNEPTSNGDEKSAAIPATPALPPAGAKPDGRPRTLSDRVKALRLPAHVTAGKPAASAHPRLPWALCAVFGLTSLVLAGYAFSRSGAGESAKLPPSGSPGASSGTVSQAGEVVLESDGYIIAAHQIQVSPKVGGMVMKLNVEAGMRVKVDEVIAEIEKVEYETDRDRIQGLLNAAIQRYEELRTGYRKEEIAQARAEMQEAEATLEQAKRDYERNTGLRQDVVSRKDFEMSKRDYEAADRRLTQKRLAYQLMVDGPRKEKTEAARHEVEQYRADLEKAKWRFENCEVKAPISGTILKTYAEKGNIVNQLALNLQGSICDMANLADLEVELKVQERDVPKVFKGQLCRVRSKAFPDRVYNGVVSRLMPIADRAQGAVPVRVKVEVPADEEGVYLKPEMGAIVSFLRK